MGTAKRQMARSETGMLQTCEVSERGVGYGSSLGRYVFGSEISYNKPPPRLPGLGC
jgi:hypothetical protein